MNTLIEYQPEIPPTDLTLAPWQNEAMLAVEWEDWTFDFTYHLNTWRREWERN
jgi:hypothetical protein